jgi:hypothetical protein
MLRAFVNHERLDNTFKQSDIVPITVFATGVVDTGGKFIARIIDTSGNLQPMLLTPMEKFVTIFVDPSGAP